jgi:hypothetical protein
MTRSGISYQGKNMSTLLTQASLLRKVKQKFYNHKAEVMQNSKINNLILEALEPRLLLNGSIELVSISSLGEQGNGGSGHSSVDISADGRYVVFDSLASNLVPGDNNLISDVFLYDRKLDQIERISVSPSGQESNGWSEYASISADGQHVAFVSTASNLVPGFSTNQYRVYIHDRETKHLEYIGISAECPSISASGRYVAFESSTKQFPDDNNDSRDIFVYDRELDVIEAVSKSSSGNYGDNASFNPDITGDGRYVTFSSFASNLVPDDTNGKIDIFVYDRLLDSIERVNVSSSGDQANGASDRSPRISGNGRYVTFVSGATNLVPGCSGSIVYVHDRQSKTTKAVSVSSSGIAAGGGSPSISLDGRFIGFYSESNQLLPGVSGGYFIHDQEIEKLTCISGPSTGPQDGLKFHRPRLSQDGKYVAFCSGSSKLVPIDINHTGDVFVAWSIENDHGGSDDSATIMFASSSIDGAILDSNDQDWFTFYAQAGQHISLSVYPGSLPEPDVILYNPDASTILWDYDNSYHLRTDVDVTGSYYISVRGGSNAQDNTGTYSLSLYVDNYEPEPALELEINSAKTGTLENIFDEDLFSFQVQAGHEYTIRTSGTIFGDLTDPFLTVIDSDGLTQLVYDDDSGYSGNALIVWTAPDDGEYYVEVSTPIGKDLYYNPGEYTLNILDGPADWTLILYIAGDNSLEEFMWLDIAEMIYGTWLSQEISPRLNVVCLVDSLENFDTTFVAAITPGWVVVDLGEQNMGNPETLSGFFNEVTQILPADNYGLIIWDHGGGFYGAALDETDTIYNNGYWEPDLLTMAEFLTSSENFNSRLDLIGFDACLMSMVEVAYQFKDIADVFVASETNEPADGWKYDEVTLALSDNPDINPSELAQAIITAYKHEYEGEYVYDDDIFTTLSVFDLTQIENLANAIDNFALEWISNASATDWNVMEQIRDVVLEIDSYFNFCDLGMLMQLVSESDVQPILAQTANYVIEILTSGLIAEWHDVDMPDASGLSIYLPRVSEEIDPLYNEEITFIRDTHWDEFIESFVAGNYGKGIDIPAKGVKFTDADGTRVTVKLVKGEGAASFSGQVTDIIQGKRGTEVVGENLILTNVNLTSSNDKTSLNIITKGGVVEGTDLGGITGGILSTLKGKQLDLVGNIELSGSLGSLTLDDIGVNVSISTAQTSAKGFSLKADSIEDGVIFDIAGTVKNFQAASFNGGSLMADNIGQIKIKEGGFGVDVEATSGDILGITAQWNITGNISASGTITKISTQYGDFAGAARAGNEIGTIQAYNLTNALLSAANNIKNVSIKNNILDTYIMAGYDIGADCAFGLQETDGGDIPGSGDIGSVIAKGEFARSYICAGKLPYTSDTMTALPSDQDFTGNFGSIGKVKFGSIAYQEANENFGLYTVNGIKPFKVGKDEVESKDYFVVDYLL